MTDSEWDKRWRKRQRLYTKYGRLCMIAQATWRAYERSTDTTERRTLLRDFFSLNRKRDDAYRAWDYSLEGGE